MSGLPNTAVLMAIADAASDDCWQVARYGDQWVLRRWRGGTLIEAYRPVAAATAQVWMAAVVAGFEPPRSLTALAQTQRKG